MEGLLAVFLVLIQEVLDVVVQVKLDTAPGLLYLHSEEGFHKPTAGDFEVGGVFCHKFCA